MNALCSMLARHVEVRPAWLDDVLGGRPVMHHDIALAFGSATHDLGRVAVAPSVEEAQQLREAGALWVAQTSVDEIARVALLCAAVAGIDDPFAIARSLYVGGDSRERAAVLRALPLLPDPLGFLSLATEGCRTNVRAVFEAIACENAYPSRWFPDRAFRQMVLKAIFVGVPIARIEGLRSRTSEELRRMARDYASERSAAGRSIPDDVHQLLATGGRGT